MKKLPNGIRMNPAFRLAWLPALVVVPPDAPVQVLAGALTKPGSGLKLSA